MSLSAQEKTSPTAPEPLVVEVFSDLICPWCYIGSRRLEAAVARLDADGGLPDGRQVQVVWQPFELNPDMPVEGRDRKEYRSAKFGSWARSQQLDAQVAGSGAAEGLAFHHELMKRTPNTRAGHRLVWLAQERGLGQQMVDRLFVAYFTQGQDIGCPEVLTALAVDVGVDPVEAGDAAAGGTGNTGAAAEAAVTAYLERAHDLRISSVPFYVLGNRYGLTGAQPAEAFLRTLRQVNDELHPATATGTGVDGVCSADGTCR